MRISVGPCARCGAVLVVFGSEAEDTIEELGGLNSANVELAELADVDRTERHLYALADVTGHFGCPACDAPNIFLGTNPN